MNRIYHTNWEYPSDKMSSFMPRLLIYFYFLLQNRFQNAQKIKFIGKSLRNCSFRIIICDQFLAGISKRLQTFSTSFSYRTSSKSVHLLNQETSRISGCVCDNNSDHEIGPARNITIGRPYYAHPEEANSDEFQCYHVGIRYNFMEYESTKNIVA